MGSSASEIQKLLQTARLHLAQGQFQEAIGRATEVIKQDGKQTAAYLVRAEAHRRLKQLERALADLAVAIRIDPNVPAPYLVRAEILKRRNMFDQAIADATHALTLDPRNAAAFSVRAACRAAIGDQEGAQEDVQEMLVIDPTRPVPDLRAGAAGDGTQTIASDDGRFWKQSGERVQEDERAAFADGKPVDKTYRSRRVVSDEDAPEALGVASGYKPETISRPIPRARGSKGRSLGSGGGAVLIVGVAVVAACSLWLALRGRSASEPVGTPVASHPSNPVDITETSNTSVRAKASIVGEPKSVEGEGTPGASGAGGADGLAVAAEVPPSRKRTDSAYRTIDLEIDRDGSGTLTLGTRTPAQVEGEKPAEAGTPVPALDGLKNAEISRLKDGRLHVVHDFKKISDIEDLKNPFNSIDPAQHQIDAKNGTLVLTPIAERDFKRAQLKYARQLRLPLRIRWVIAGYVEDGFIGLPLYWSKSILNTNLQGISPDRKSPRGIEVGWLLDQSKQNEWNSLLKSGDPVPQTQTFQVPLSLALAEDRVSPSIGIRTGDRSTSTLKIRRIEVTAHFVGKLGITFDERKGKVVAAQLLEGAGARAGIKPGDQFASIDGQPVKSMAAVMSRLAKLDAGSSVKIDVLRDGKPTTLSVVAD